MALNTGLRSSSNGAIMAVVAQVLVQVAQVVPGLSELASTPEFAASVTALLMWLGSRFTRTPAEPKVV